MIQSTSTCADRAPAAPPTQHELWLALAPLSEPQPPTVAPVLALPHRPLAQCRVVVRRRALNSYGEFVSASC